MCIYCIYNSKNVCKWCMSGSATENNILLSVLPRLNKIFDQSINLQVHVGVLKKYVIGYLDYNGGSSGGIVEVAVGTIIGVVMLIGLLLTVIICVRRHHRLTAMKKNAALENGQSANPNVYTSPGGQTNEGYLAPTRSHFSTVSSHHTSLSRPSQSTVSSHHTSISGKKLPCCQVLLVITTHFKICIILFYLYKFFLYMWTKFYVFI